MNNAIQTGLSTDLNYASRSDDPSIGVLLLNTYKYSTRKCVDDKEAGKSDWTLDRLDVYVDEAGYDVEDFLDHTYITNYVEPVPPTNLKIDELEAEIAISHQLFQARLAAKRPLVLLSLVGVTSGLQDRVTAAAKACKVMCIQSVHPAFAHCWAHNRRDLVESIREVCRIAGIKKKVVQGKVLNASSV